ncbi:MAG: Rrf2 family transcriptional regulator [Deltaproteobacteria bacterium]|nr:MAG: Rrf2 family transcriptional regulator [Deltaproteobacteria bacterium]RUA02853.1 MAG: Rrf2 family transcriptional regulator [Deltaproteobacteria bacterium]
MRLTRAAEYAIRCILYLTLQGRGIVVKRQTIASEADIPPHFLAKIAQDLARAGLIETRQGPQGGIALIKDAKAISLLTVVEIMIGQIFLNDCVALPDSCKVSYNCSVHQVWMRARDQLRATLAEVTFDQLAHEGPCVPILPEFEVHGGR